MLSPRFKKSLKIHRKTPLRESLFRKGRRLTTIQNNYLLINSEKLLLGIVVIHLASCLAFSPKNGLYNTPNIFKFNLFKVFYFTLKWLFVRCRDRDEVHHILRIGQNQPVEGFQKIDRMKVLDFFTNIFKILHALTVEHSFNISTLVIKYVRKMHDILPIRLQIFYRLYNRPG